MTKPGFRRSRSVLAGEALIRSAHGDWRTPLQDLSLSGLHIQRPPGFELAIGHPLELELRCGPPEATLRLQVRARVARRDSETISLSFERPGPLFERELQAMLETRGILRDDVVDT
jgi:hypothetical protein